MTEDSPSTIAAHFRALALDAYAVAALITDESERQVMHQIALGYEHLASNAEERARTAELAAAIPKTA